MCVSNYNTSEQVVISGHIKAVEEVTRYCEGLGARISYLNVSAPFHSPLMKPAADRLRSLLDQIKLYPLKFKIISNVTASPYSSHEDIPNMLYQQIFSPVLWENSLKYIENKRYSTLIDIGPRNILKSMVPSLKVVSFEGDDNTSIESYFE